MDCQRLGMKAHDAPNYQPFNLISNYLFGSVRTCVARWKAMKKLSRSLEACLLVSLPLFFSSIFIFLPNHATNVQYISLLLLLSSFMHVTILFVISFLPSFSLLCPCDSMLVIKIVWSMRRDEGYIYTP